MRIFGCVNIRVVGILIFLIYFYCFEIGSCERFKNLLASEKHNHVIIKTAKKLFIDVLMKFFSNS